MSDERQRAILTILAMLRQHLELRDIEQYRDHLEQHREEWKQRIEQVMGKWRKAERWQSDTIH